MGKLRVPFFVIAIVAAGLVVLVELGSSLLIGGRDATTTALGQAAALGADVPGGTHAAQPPGLGIPYLALVDVILLYTVALMGAGLLVPDRVHGRIQGIVTLIGAIILILLALVLLVVAIVELILMVTLLLAFPFGTIAYLIIWGSFPRGDAAVVLSLLMFLKFVFVGALLLAHQCFVQNKGLVLLTATLLVCNIVVAFLHGLVPGFLVSILDRLAAIVVAIVAIIWAIVLIVGSIVSVITAIRATLAVPGATLRNILTGPPSLPVPP